jgi:hypothetical protein
MGFETFLRLIQETDLVRAGVVNAPLQQTDQNTRYLWELIQAASIGSTVYAHRQTVESAAQQGMAVWLNPATQQFERGLAAAAVDASSGIITTSPSAQVWGIVAQKLNTTLADILLFGLDDINIAQAVGVAGNVPPGVYYLSGTTPGMLTQQKPPISVAVLRVTTDGRVFVMPQFVDVLDRHVHYRIPMFCSPAGTTSPPAPGDRHVITAPDPLLPGWLPADHESFNGVAPHGAVFGYNLLAHPQLQNAWPPVPFSNAYLEWDKALDQDTGYTGVPVTGENPLCVLDRNGLWWMSDCYGDVPWPADLDTSSPISQSGSVADQCPRVLNMAMQVWFTKINFATDLTSVLSLHGDSRIKVTCYGTNTPAATGHLQLTLDLNLVVATDQPGYLALKTFDPNLGVFTQGPVTEGVYALTDNVLLTGDVGGARLVNGVPQQVFQGLVGLSVQPRDTLELAVQLVRLDGAEEEYFQDIMFLGFVPGDQRQYRAKIEIPSDLNVPNSQLKLRFQILGTVFGTLPQLNMTARRVPRPDGLNSIDLPQDPDEFDVICNTNQEITDNYSYLEVESDPFDVAAGDSIFFTVQRTATDGYTGEVGILRQSGVIISGE